MRRAILGICLLFINTAEGVLSPYFESLSEYQALLANPELSKVISSGEAIQEIQRNETHFVITTTKQVIFVQIVYEKMKRPGPLKFHFVFPHEAENNEAIQLKK